MEVIQAEFARIAGVSRASISGKISNKTLIINAAGMLDTDNPVNATYLSKHRQKQAQASAVEQIQAGEKKSFTGETFQGNASSPPGVRQDDFALIAAAQLPAREMLNMTLREIVLKYPGIDKIERYSKILKDTTMSAEREQRIQERDLTLIPKDFVVSRLFSFIEGLIKQIVEYPESMIDRIIALANTESETSRQEIIDTMTNSLTQIISGSKKTIIEELNGLKNKYQNETQSRDRIEEIKDAIEEVQSG